MNYPETKFVTDFRPGDEVRVKLKNGRFVDVVQGRYFDPGVGLIIKRLEN